MAFDEERKLRVHSIADDTITLHDAGKVVDPNTLDLPHRGGGLLDGLLRRVIEALVGLRNDLEKTFTMLMAAPRRCDWPRVALLSMGAGTLGRPAG